VRLFDGGRRELRGAQSENTDAPAQAIPTVPMLLRYQAKSLSDRVRSSLASYAD